ncbi:MAG: CRTAC1 family protein, partial [bacterium]
AIGDADNDQDLDLFISHLRTESNTFYRNNGQAGFRDDSSPARLAGQSLSYTGFGAGFVDFDHDGDLDLAVVNGRVSRGPLLKQSRTDYWDDYAESNFLFENDGTGKFKRLDESFTNLIENSRGLAFGDVDNDGGVDLLVSNEGGYARLFLSKKNDKGAWLTVRAVDPALKRDAIGATVSVAIAGKRLTRLIAPGYSYLSSNDPRAHFGLGNNLKVDQIEVRWPGGGREIFPGNGVNKMITLLKGNGQGLRD